MISSEDLDTSKVFAKNFMHYGWGGQFYLQRVTVKPGDHVFRRSRLYEDLEYDSFGIFADI
jgi:hypothetical protein